MTHALGSLPEPSAPLVRSCREVIDTAGAITAVIARDPRAILSGVAQVNPALATQLAALSDRAMDLDLRTGFLAGTYPDQLLA